jgi:hypothetical protein
MKFEVRTKQNGSLALETNDFERARVASALKANWNTPCDVIDTETKEVVHTTTAYRDIFRKDQPPTLGWDVIDGQVVFVTAPQV